MKKLLFKYFALIIISFGISIIIYNYIESFKPIKTEKDILTSQEKTEKKLLKKTNYTVDNPNIILNPYGNSPLTALIVFETKDLTTATITIKGEKDITHTFMPAKVHILPIYGLYPNKDNKIIIEVSGKTKEITIKTDALPDDFPKVNNLISDSDEDFYFTSFENSKYTAAFDSNGNVRWYTAGDYMWDIHRLNNGHILIGSDKSIASKCSAGLIEMDLLGKIYFEYLIPGGYHHDVYEMPNGNFLALSKKSYNNSIIEIDRNTGNIVKEVNLNKLFKTKTKTNSLTYDSSTNSILITLNDMIANIDYSSLNINYIIGNDLTDNLKKYAFSGNKYPSKPTSIDVIDGKIIISTLKNNERYIYKYIIDYSNRSFELIDKIKIGEANNINIYNISNDKYLVSNGNKIIKINDDFKLELDDKIYNSEKLTLYANDIYTKGKGQRLGSLGKSKIIKSHFILKTYKSDKIVKKYNINLYKDVLGLKVSGSFKEKDKVEIILDNFLDKKTYTLQTNNSKISSRYINEDRIHGKYYIYIKINGKIYKLYKYVNFH